MALEEAKETIYIADWWLSPELFLRRPPFMAQEWRLDQVLKRRAEAGVKIYVIVYKEVRSGASHIVYDVAKRYGLGQPSIDLQLRSYQARAAQSLSRRKPWVRKHQSPAPSGS